MESVTMKTIRMRVGWILLLVLTAKTGATVQGQQIAQQAWRPNEARADALWYGRNPSEKIGEHPQKIEKNPPCLAHCSPCPQVYGYVEGMFLERSNSSYDQPLLVQREFGTPVATLLRTSDLDFNYEPAARVVLGSRVYDGWAIEGVYFGLWDADSSAYVATDEALTLPDGLGAGGQGGGSNVWSSLNRTWVDYSSDLQSAELNLVYCCGGCAACGAGKGDYAAAGPSCSDSRCRTFEWLAGFRFLDLSEELRIYGEKDAGDPPAVESGVYDILTRNHLYGGQLGARFRCWGTRLGWEATGKLGIFGNDADQEQYVTDYPEFELRPRTGAEGCEVAFVGDLNLSLIYRLSDVWSLRGGYNLIWISGVALAPDQLDFSGTLPAGDRLHSNGSLFLHGVSCGVEARW